MAVQEIGDTILGSVLTHEQDSTSPEDKSGYEIPRRDEEGQKEMRRELREKYEKLRLEETQRKEESVTLEEMKSEQALTCKEALERAMNALV